MCLSLKQDSRVQFSGGPLDFWYTLSMKRCNKCAKFKSLDDFGVCRSSTDGRQRKCVLCNREQAKQYYHSTQQKTKHGERARCRQKRIADALSEIKTIAGCKFCNERCAVCLDLHHLNDDKEFNLSRCVYAISKVKDELAKCEVVCANCHRKVHAGLLVVTEARNFDTGPLDALSQNTRRYSRKTVILA